MSEHPDAWEERAAEEDREAARSRETPGTRGAHGTMAPASSRRTFLFFLLVAPAGLAAVFAILLALQYKQFQSMVSPSATVKTFSWSDEGRRHLDTLESTLRAFADGGGPDTLRFSPADLTLLAVSSPAAERQRIRFRISSTDSLLVVESAQPVDALSGRFARIFRKISPVRDGWLNARMLGYPEWKGGVLSFFPQRGFLNGTSVPRTALTKRAGLSPGDFIDPSREAEYREFLAVVDTVLLDYGGNVLIVRRLQN